uniref:hypothetical protein n=1 Tax=Enterococcus hirae TaxID=1354 RepID=UPI0015EFC60F|nr:hypothetical protein [Enterococcus hirae]
MADLLRKKDIETIIKKKGMNYSKWKDEVISQARMSIIDKVGEEYKNWESELLHRKAIELLTEEILKGNHQQQNSNNFKKEEENINGK